MAAVEIVTPRLVLRTASLADVEEVQRAKLDLWHELQLWTFFALDEQRSLSSLQSYVRYAQGTPEFVVGFRRDTGAFAVATGLGTNDLEPDVYELGYWVAREQQGLGFATEASEALMAYAFETLGAQAITISYYEGNQASANVVRKLGFPFVRTGFGERKRCLDGAPVDVHFFRRERD